MLPFYSNLDKKASFYSTLLVRLRGLHNTKTPSDRRTCIFIRNAVATTGVARSSPTCRLLAYACFRFAPARTLLVRLRGLHNTKTPSDRGGRAFLFATLLRQREWLGRRRHIGSSHTPASASLQPELYSFAFGDYTIQKPPLTEGVFVLVIPTRVELVLQP